MLNFVDTLCRVSITIINYFFQFDDSGEARIFEYAVKNYSTLRNYLRSIRLIC